MLIPTRSAPLEVDNNAAAVSLRAQEPLALANLWRLQATETVAESAGCWGPIHHQRIHYSTAIALAPW